MAKLIPEVDPEEIVLKPERDVARALVRDLPKDCLIYHSYCWLRRDKIGNRETLREGETDFVILDPEYGLLVLEVKGGDVRHRVNDGKDEYFRLLPNGEERSIGNVFEQARNSLHTLIGILQISKPTTWFGGCYGYAVAFPDQTCQGTIPNDADPSIVFLAEHLDDMGRAVRGAFKRWSRVSNPKLTPEALRLCRERLRPVFGLFPASWRNLGQDDEQLIALTLQQQQTLEGLSENRRIAVRGGAGTGKTMLALWKAIEFAKEGNETLFLCFNRFLAQWLNQRVNDELDHSTRSRLKITTFHALCREFYERTQHVFSPPQNREQRTEFWSKTVPNKMFDTLLDEVPNLRFDAIVVDEAQDFRTDWWLVIEALQRELNGPLAIFHDPNQNIFRADEALPKTDAVFNLKLNCRNTQKIHDYSAKLVNADLKSSSRSPVGLPPIESTVTGMQEQRDRCDSLIRNWKTQFRLTPDRFAILTSASGSRSCFDGVASVAGMHITSDLSEWKNGEGVLLSTISAFKGLEADAIVLLTQAEDQPTPSDLYVATSRAKHLLAVINKIH